MVLDHVAIMNKDEDGAVRFYKGILGLQKIKKSFVSSELARQLFGLDREIGCSSSVRKIRRSRYSSSRASAFLPPGASFLSSGGRPRRAPRKGENGIGKGDIR